MILLECYVYIFKLINSFISSFYTDNTTYNIGQFISKQYRVSFSYFFIDVITNWKKKFMVNNFRNSYLQQQKIV